MTPRRVLNSVAWRHLSFRARAILQVFQDRHDGFNNGRIGLGIHQIGKLLGNQNHGANSRAVAELIKLGFLECVSDADRKNSKVREYRLTFVSSGDKRNLAKASHEYEGWRPVSGKTKKFGGAKTATQEGVSVADTATIVKNSVAEIAPNLAESPEFCTMSSGANSALHLYNQSSVPLAGSESPSSHNEKLTRADLCCDVDDLRQWTLTVIEYGGYGSARSLAHDAGIPEAALSRFRSGRNLPDRYRIPLQHACGRALRYSEFISLEGKTNG